MIDETGKLAGLVWEILEQRGPMTLEALSKKLKKVSPEEVGLAVGWLAREDQVKTVHHRKSIRISLR